MKFPAFTARDWSLRTRLLLIAALASLATLLAGSAAMFWAAEKEDQRLLDSRLEDLARTVLSFSEHEITEILGEGRTEMMHTETAATLGSRYRYQIWTRHGTLVLHSYLSSKIAPMQPLGQTGFSTQRIEGEEFRVFAMEGNGGEMVIQVAECLDERESALGAVSAYFIAFLVLPITLIFVATWWMLRRSLRAIDTSAAQLSTRSPIDLTPVVTDNPPRELQPMISSINSLLGRVERTLSLERGFTAVAAHELRTPLAGLRAQAQIAVSATSPAELAEALALEMSGVDRASHLLDQLLDLARIEAGALPVRREAVDLAELARQVLAERAEAALAGGHDLALAGPEGSDGTGPAQGRDGGVVRVPELLVEGVEDRQRGVQADEVAQPQRAHRVRQPGHHRLVDVLHRGDALLHQPLIRPRARPDQADAGEVIAQILVLAGQRAHRLLGDAENDGDRQTVDDRRVAGDVPAVDLDRGVRRADLAQRPGLEMRVRHRIEHGDAGAADQANEKNQPPVHFQQLVGKRKRALGGGIGTKRHQPPAFTGWGGIG